jgi:hypothetical protein
MERLHKASVQELIGWLSDQTTLPVYPGAQAQSFPGSMLVFVKLQGAGVSQLRVTLLYVNPESHNWLGVVVVAVVVVFVVKVVMVVVVNVVVIGAGLSSVMPA